MKTAKKNNSNPKVTPTSILDIDDLDRLLSYDSNVKEFRHLKNEVRNSTMYRFDRIEALIVKYEQIRIEIDDEMSELFFEHDRHFHF
ncbi:MAG: hypothetical protein K2P81_00615 [Bacteriovoracaceae bacterium]|nr:hypothetical protein [Bacteriovoracaceae bacterium]